MPDLAPSPRLPALCAAIALIAAAFGAPSVAAAAGAGPGLDTATATGDNLIADDFSATDIEVDARSGPSGEDPAGSASFVAGAILPIAGPVSCLHVTGNAATMTVEGPFPSAPAYSQFLVRLVDNGGAGQDVFQYFPDDPGAPDVLDCRKGSDVWFGGSLIGRAIVADVRPDPPVITGLSMRPRSFAVADRRAGRSGSSIEIVLSAESTVAFRVRRARPARTGGAPPKHSRRFKRALGAGESSVPFSGRLGGFTFRPGRYRLTARARDSLKQPSQRVATSFRILP